MASAAVKHKAAANLTGVEDKLVRRILSPDRLAVGRA
jgi:hypothetical protein